MAKGVLVPCALMDTNMFFCGLHRSPITEQVRQAVPLIHAPPTVVAHVTIEISVQHQSLQVEHP